MRERSAGERERRQVGVEGGDGKEGGNNERESDSMTWRERIT